MTSVKESRRYYGMPSGYDPDWLKRSLHVPLGVPELKNMAPPFSYWGSVDVLNPTGQVLEPEYEHALKDQPKTLDQAEIDLGAARFLLAYSRGLHLDKKHGEWRKKAEKAAPARRELQKRRVAALKTLEKMERDKKKQDDEMPEFEIVNEDIHNESYTGKMSHPGKTAGLKLPKRYPSKTQFVAKTLAQPGQRNPPRKPDAMRSAKSGKIRSETLNESYTGVPYGIESRKQLKRERGPKIRLIGTREPDIDDDIDEIPIITLPELERTQQRNVTNAIKLINFIYNGLGNYTPRTAAAAQPLYDAAEELIVALNSLDFKVPENAFGNSIQSHRAAIRFLHNGTSGNSPSLPAFFKTARGRKLAGYASPSAH